MQWNILSNFYPEVYSILSHLLLNYSWIPKHTKDTLLIWFQFQFQTLKKTLVKLVILCLCVGLEWRGECSPVFSSSEHLRLPVILRPSVRLSVLLSVNFFILSRTTGPVSTKLGTKHPWVKGIHVSSNERSCLYPRGDNNEIAKIYYNIIQNT